MASLIDELIDVLEKEDEAYKAFTILAKEKTGYIVNNDIENLAGIVEKEQLIVEHIGGIDKKREELSKDIANVLGIEGVNVTIRQIAVAIKEHKDEHERLVNVYKELRRTLDLVERVNGTNASLINENLEMINFEINLAQAARMQPQTADYSRGTENYDNLQSGSFDAKQ